MRGGTAHLPFEAVVDGENVAELCVKILENLGSVIEFRFCS